LEQSAAHREKNTADVPAPAPGAASAEAQVQSVRQDLKFMWENLDQLIKINGYYDFEYANDDKADSPGEFKQHHLSLFFDKRLEKYHFFSEVEFEYAPDYVGTGGAVTGKGEFKVETVWLEYQHSELVNLRAGKVLLPQYWTVNHYPSIMVSTSRPLLVKNVFPFEISGVSAYGERYFDNDWGAGYTLLVGNGGAPDPAKNDVNEDKSAGSRLTAHIPLFDRFDFSGSNYIGKDASSDRVHIWGVDSQINIAKFELLTEAAHGSKGNNFAFYVQPSYEFLPKWTGFYRLDGRDDNNKLDDPDDVLRHTYGLRYKPLPQVSLKGEYYYEIPDDAKKEKVNGLLSSVVLFF
jgi:hypothetical protein